MAQNAAHVRISAFILVFIKFTGATPFANTGFPLQRLPYKELYRKI